MELAEYDQSVTVEDCHGMSIGEIRDRIEGCRQHEETERSTNCGGSNVGNESGNYGNHSGHHGGHHNR